MSFLFRRTFLHHIDGGWVWGGGGLNGRLYAGARQLMIEGEGTLLNTKYFN